MAADYEAIRAENIARYGWDTAVLDLLGQLYSERTHFLFELIQNAEDAGATELAFELFADRLEMRHDGRPFTEADVRGVCGVGRSQKAGQLNRIGKFGIGFKSVYAYTRTPRIYSGGEAFRIENFVRPFPVDPEAGPGTRFVFPFDHDAVPAAVAVREISAALTVLDPRILLFLTGIGQVRTAGPGRTASVLERRAERAGGSSRRITLSRIRERRRHEEEWLVWSRPAAEDDTAEDADGTGSRTIEVAFLTRDGRITACEASPLTVFFPTEKETFLGFVVQGPYRTTPARDNVPADDPSNQALAGQTAELLTGVLRELRDGGQLTAGVLATLPVEEARFGQGSLLRPLFDAVRAELAGEALLPVAGGGYARAADLRLAAGPELPRLLDPGQLGELSGAGGPASFADPGITAEGTPALWRYLRDELGIAEVTAEDVVARLSSAFLAARPDEWIVRLYAFLAGRPSLWPAAGRQPVIRLEDGGQVPAFGAEERPAVYLPGPAPSRLPTVRRSIAGTPAARPFLAALNLAEPDVAAEALEVVLPRYDDLDVADLDASGHDADLETVARALDEAPPGPREELLDRLRRTPFLVGENAATGEPALRPPPTLYARTKDLEIYFDGNPGAWFAADGYGPWLPQLRRMGVRDRVEVTARAPHPLGYVVLVSQFGRNERGLDGFDPDAQVDGLEFALEHPAPDRSEFIWNTLLAPNRHLIAGVVERSVLASFTDASREEVRSAIAAAAGREAWLPARDGSFRRPAELSLDDLPPTFVRDEGLAQALGMLQAAVAQAARQLGVPVEVLWGLSAHPDLVAMVERELAARGQ